MATARRLYLYGVSAAALTLLITGADNLLRLLLAHLGPQSTSSLVQVSGNPEREGLSLGLALVAVGLPLWIIHWGIVERGVRAGDGGAAERRSIVRAAFLGVAGFGLVVVAAASTVTIVTELLSQALLGHSSSSIVLDGQPVSGDLGPDLSGPAAWAILGWAFCAYHWSVRRRDIRSGALDGGSASLTRLYFYGTALVAALAALQAAANAGHAAWTQIAYSTPLDGAPLSYGSFYPGDSTFLIVSAAATFLVWGAVSAVHFWYPTHGLVTAGAVAAVSEADRTAPPAAEDAAEFGPEATFDAAPAPAPALAPAPAPARLPGMAMVVDHDAPAAPVLTAAGGLARVVAHRERQARLRIAYLSVFSLVGAVAAGFAIVGAGQVALGAAFGANEPLGASHRGPAIVDALLVAVPYLLAWSWYAVLARVESLAAAPAAPSPRRISSYLVALVGVAFTGFGIGNLVFLVLSRAFGSTLVAAGSTDAWRYDVATAAAQASAGLLLWLWPWLAARHRLATDPGEAVSTARRWYLCAVAAASLIAASVGTAIVVYQTVRVVLGDSSADLGDAVSAPLAAALVGAVLFVAHATALRRDLALAGERPRGVATTMPPAAVPATSRVLVIAGPPDADLDAVRAALAAQLPAGYSLEIKPAG